jgi:biopolymer transport protein ExbD/biopolymer transport protein TolR
MAMDMGGGPNKAGRAAPSMNVTPLVDVVLVLLIIFMVITPMLAKQFWLHLPAKPDDTEQEPPAPGDEKPIVVFVTSAGEFQINRDVIPKASFSHKIRGVLAASGRRTVFFDAAEDAQFGKAVEAMDLARAGGAATIVVLTAALRQD